MAAWLVRARGTLWGTRLDGALSTRLRLQEAEPPATCRRAPKSLLHTEPEVASVKYGVSVTMMKPKESAESLVGRRFIRLYAREVFECNVPVRPKIARLAHVNLTRSTTDRPDTCTAHLPAPRSSHPASASWTLARAASIHHYLTAGAPRSAVRSSPAYSCAPASVRHSCENADCTRSRNSAEAR